MAENYLCIGGSGRSGTSILSRIFEAHPDVAVVPEWRYMVDPDGLVDFCGEDSPWTPYSYDLRLKRLESVLRRVTVRTPVDLLSAALQRAVSDVPGFRQRVWRRPYAGLQTATLCPAFSAHVDALMAELGRCSFSGQWLGQSCLDSTQISWRAREDYPDLRAAVQQFLDAVISDVLQATGKQFYLEKNTWSILAWDRILALVPVARLVHIYRDPRDVVSSFLQQRWMPSDPLLAAKCYVDTMAEWRRVAARVDPSSFLEISLEALVRDRRAVLQKLCELWSLPWHDGLMTLRLSDGSLGRWQQDPRLAERPDVLELLKPVCDELHYGD